MKVKTNELTDATLDWAVAKCEGILHPWGYVRVQDGRTMWTPGDHETADAWHQYSPSIDWTQGGPIIERENIALYPHGDGTYEAEVFLNPKRGAGPTPLIAAMRCLVASKLGDEVEIPSELVS